MDSNLIIPGSELLRSVIRKIGGEKIQASYFRYDPNGVSVFCCHCFTDFEIDIKLACDSLYKITKTSPDPKYLLLVLNNNELLQNSASQNIPIFFEHNPSKTVGKSHALIYSFPRNDRNDQLFLHILKNTARWHPGFIDKENTV